jgi:nucleoside-diphosphate-sugar epimerase
MRCMVTGSTGFIGSSLVKELLKLNVTVHVLVRSKQKLAAEILNHVTVFEGELHDSSLLDAAMKGCDHVFHLAGSTVIWSKDKTLASRINVEGTRNILEAAVRNHIKKVVFTSTAGTLPPSADDKPVDENAPAPTVYLTDYELSKRQAELVCADFATRGLDVVIVNPTRVYGPGLLNKSNSVTILIKKYINGTWRFIPGAGSQTGNYVYIGDVVQGHLLALEKGRSGERYILGGENISFNRLFEIMAEACGKKYKLFSVPASAMTAFANVELFLADRFGKPPLITPAWLKRYNQDRLVSSMKAMKELGYHITPLSQGIKETITWLTSNNKLNGNKFN